MNGELSVSFCYGGKGGTQMTKGRVGISSKELCISHSKLVCWSVFVSVQTKSNLAWADTFSWSWWSYSAVIPVSVRSEPEVLWRGLNSCVESGMWFSCSPWVDPGHTELVCTSKRRYDYSTGRQIVKRNSFSWADHEEGE